MIKAIFFSKFDVTEGPKVLHQVPANSIVASPDSNKTTLFHFPDISSYIIPRQEFCSGLVTIVANSYRILGHPVCLPSPRYPRNEFLFNFCLVLNASDEFSPHLTVTLKLASLLRTLEEQSHFLSRDTSPPNTGKIYALCEILLEDLNNYCESMIPIDASNTLNIKLFPTYPPPPPLLPHHVPLSTVRLSALVDPNWDLTMLLILPYINGINSVAQIALAADADYQLVRKALSHLLYYRCIFLLDIFSFAAIYAPTAQLADFVGSPELQGECARYVTVPYEAYGHGGDDDGGDLLSGTELVELYCALKHGQSVRHFCIEHAAMLDGIDIRRFITFGVIKGFLYRVHKYAILLSSAKGAHHYHNHHRSGKKKLGIIPTPGEKRKTIPFPSQSTLHAQTIQSEDTNNSRLSTNPTPNAAVNDSTTTTPKKKTPDERKRHAELARFLDGTHCFDEICTQLQLSERELLARIKALEAEGGGEVQIIHR